MADLDRVALADTLIADIITPYLLHSCPELIQSMGRERFACAQRLYRKVSEACAGDDKARRTLELFEEDPETYSSSFGLVLQRLLAQDESWALTIQQQITAFTASMQGESTVAGSGAIAASGGTAAGERGVAVRGTVAGGIHIYGAQPPAPVQEMTEPERLRWQEQATYLAEAMRAYATLLRSKVERVSELPRTPYKNLFYYELSDESIFFGREQATQQFLDHIRGRGKARRLTVLHAPSGAGKTSLINAGITPSLLRAGDVTLYALARIGTDYENPAAAIRKRILDAAPADQPQPDPSKLSLHDFLRLATVGLDGRQLVIFLDQFEEFFIHLSPEVRAPFINALATCYDDEALPVKFVISIRKDYFSDLSELETAMPTVFYNQFKLELLTRSQAAEAITRPVAPLGIRYTPELVEILLDDLESSGMELPHLQLICSRLYETRQGNTIALDDYEALGRAEGILGSYLASFMDQLGSLRPIAQDVLVEMVTSEDTKRVMSRAELGARVGEEGLDEILTRLVAGRLLRREEEGGVIRYEMAHEYLIREITTWIDAETRARKRAEELLAQEVYAWQQFGTLIGPDKLDIIATHREHIRFTPEAQELLLRSALANGHDLALWPELVGDASLRKQILDEFTTEPRAAVRAHAAWAWSNLDEPASIPALMTLALADSSPVVTAVASEGLLRLERQRDEALRELVSIARSDDRSRRGRALAILTRVPLEGLEPGLRWRITMTRLRLAISHLYNRLLPRPYRRVVAVSVAILVLLFGIVYGFLASSYYLDVQKGSTSGYNDLIIVHNGHPSLQSLPGFDQIIVESDFGLGDVCSKEQEKLTGKQVVTFKWQKGDADYELWAQKALMLFAPDSRAYYGWYLGDSPEIAIENLKAAISDKEVAPELPLATLEQVIATANDPVVTQQAIASLTPLLSDEDPKLRVAGVIGLSRVVTPKTNPDTITQVISNIAPRFEDNSNDVRAAFWEAIFHIAVVTALNDSATTNYAIDNIVGRLQGVRQPDEHSIMSYYRLSELIRRIKDKTIAAQTIAAVAPFIDNEPPLTFDSVMQLLGSAADVDAEVAIQVVEVLSPSLETLATLAPQYGYFYPFGNQVFEILAYAANQTDDPAVARDVYSALIPLLNHNNRKVRVGAVEVLMPVAAMTEDPNIVNETLNILIELSCNDDEDSDIRQTALMGIRAIVAAEEGPELPQDVVNKTFDILIKLYRNENEDSDIRQAALNGIAYFVAEGDPEITERGIAILLGEIGSEDPDICDVAIKSLGIAVRNPLVAEQVFENLTALAQDNLVDKRIGAGFALRYILQTTDSPLVARQAASVISTILEDPLPEICTSMGQILASDYYYSSDYYYYYHYSLNNTPEVVSELFANLAPLLGEDNPYINRVIADVLVRMVERIDDAGVANQVITVLLPFANHEDVAVRQSVVHILAKAATETDDPVVVGDVVTALLPLLKKDEDNDIQSLAADSLGQMIDIVGDPRVAANVSKELEALLKHDDGKVRSSAFSACAHARSWLDTQLLFSQLQNPLDKQERDIAGRALFLAALRNQDQLTPIKEELDSLRDAREPFVRIAASQTLEMLNLAALVHDTTEGSTNLNWIRSYLGEMALDPNLSGPSSNLRPYALDHIRFAAGEALTELGRFEQAQSESE